MIDENVMIAVSNLATKIKKLVSDHAAIKGNGSTFGHVKASDSSLIRPIGDTLEVGTDNNQYARADHVHTVTYSKIKNPPYIPSKTSDLTNDSGFLTEHQDISGKVNIAQGSSKANMNVVTNASGNITTEAKPFIPSKTSDLTNDSGYLTQHQDISGKEDKTNKTSSWNSTPNNTRYPTEKLVKDSLDNKINTNDSRLTDARDPKNTLIDASQGNAKNLNDYINIGFYYCFSNNSRAKYVVNTPLNILASGETFDKTTYVGSSNTSFYLTVEVGSSSDFIKQTLTYYSTGKTYIRVNNSGDWTNWKQLSTTDHTHSQYLTSVPTASTTQAGITQLNTATNSTSTTEAATPSAVKAAYDLANGKANSSHTHGNLQNNGQVGSTAQASKNVVTDESGKITTEDKYVHPSHTAYTGKPGTNQTPAFGETATISQVTSDSNGHVTTQTNRTIKIPNTVADGTTPGLSTNDYTSEEKAKLNGIETSANNYTHPSYTAKTGKPTANQTPAFGGTATVSQITSDSTGHVTRATDRTIKIPNTLANGTTAGLSTNDYTTTEKTKLSGIATGATKNTVSNSLSDTSTTNALSAAKGADLQTQINNIVSGTTATDHNHDSRYNITLTKLSTPTNGYIATYEVEQGGTSLGKIDIPKDYLVKSGSVKTATSADLATLGNEYSVGDKYIDFVVNVHEGSGTDEHIYINVKDLVDVYTHPNSGVTAGTNYNSNQTPAFGATFNIPKLTFNAQGHITASANSTVKIPNNLGNGTTAGLSTNDYTTTEKTKLSGIEEEANKYTHPTGTAKTGNPTANQTPAFGSTFKVTQFTSNSTGHISGATDRTIKIPNTLGDGTTAGLSTNDYTTTEKTKLSGIATGATKNTVENSLSSDSTTNALSAAQGKILKDSLDDKQENLEKGSYNSGDLNDTIFMKQGWYKLNCNTANAFENLPSALNNINSLYCKLEVKVYSNYIIQVLYAMKTNNNAYPKIFYRKKAGATNTDTGVTNWDTDWKEVVNTNTLESSKAANTPPADTQMVQ